MKTVIVFRTGVLGTWREKYTGIAAFAKTAGWQLQPVDARTVRPDFGKILDFWKPHGIILDASGAPEMFKGEKFKGIPTVVMNPAKSVFRNSAPSVYSDSREIAKLAMSELLKAGPESLVYVEWFNPSIEWSCAKREMARDIAAMHGLPFRTIAPSATDAADQSKFVERIAETLQSMPMPCGVFAATDMIGAAAIAAAGKIEAEIPAKVAVVSVDDDPEICENCSPTLTSVRPDFYRLGFSAGRLLAKLIEGGRPANVNVPPLGVVRRASTQTMRFYDRKVALAMEKIRLRACEGISPKDVACAFGVSRRMVEIRFKAATGKTIGEAILERRLAVACDYLLDGKSSVSAIANFCGWESAVAFRKAFRSRFGKSPLQWLAAQRLTDVTPA